MSWIRKVIEYKKVREGAFFTAVDPADFYEWKFTNLVPKGTKFTSYLPSSDTFTKGLVIASTKADPEMFTPVGSGVFETSDDSPLNVELFVGLVNSPTEILDKYDRMKKKFSKNVGNFKLSCQSQKYLISPKYGKPHLYSITDKDEDGEVIISDYGSLTDIYKKLSETQQKIAKDALTKKGRAYELETLRRFENVLTILNNRNINPDTKKIDYIFKLSEIKPIQERYTNWKDCYIDLSSDGASEESSLKTLSSLKWIQSASKIMKN